VLRPARSARFQALFHSPCRGAFHRSLTVLVPYRSLAVFSLGWWSTQFPTRCRVSGSTHGCRSRARSSRRLRDSHPVLSPVPEAFGCELVVARAVRHPLHLHRTTPERQRQRARTPPRFGLLPVRSPLLRESSLFLRVLRCFSSPGTLRLRGNQLQHWLGCPIRRSLDHRLPAPPQSISPRGRVLHRPPTPRHPPCAQIRGILLPTVAPRSPTDPERSVRRGGAIRPATHPCVPSRSARVITRFSQH
jgi:hypothetical protein